MAAALSRLVKELGAAAASSSLSALAEASGVQERTWRNWFTGAVRPSALKFTRAGLACDLRLEVAPVSPVGYPGAALVEDEPPGREAWWAYELGRRVFTSRSTDAAVYLLALAGAELKWARLCLPGTQDWAAGAVSTVSLAEGGPVQNLGKSLSGDGATERSVSVDVLLRLATDQKLTLRWTPLQDPWRMRPWRVPGEPSPRAFDGPSLSARQRMDRYGGRSRRPFRG